MKKRSFFILVSLFFMLGQYLFAQVETEVKPIKSKTFSAKALDKSFIQLISKNDQVKTLSGYLVSQGYSAQRGIKNFYGVSETYKDVATKKKVIYSYQFQDYTKANSKENVALCHISATSAGATESYTFYLFAKDGNYEEMEEYFIDQKLNIQKANSWWSCTKKRIAKKCPGQCLAGFVTCVPGNAGSVVGYLVCVAGNCAGCLVRAGACCACDCHWYCKWATGCCDR
jgi:hypothetical protein